MRFTMVKLRSTLALISRQLIGTEKRLAVTKNIGWMLMDRVFRMGLSVLIVIWMARVFGPEQFGQYNFALSVIGILAVITGLGLHGVVVREVVKRPKHANNIISAGFVALCFVGGLGAALTAGIAISWETPYLPTYLIAILSLTLVMKSTDIVRSWFESQMQSRITILAENGVFLCMAAVRIYFILTEMPLMAFIWLLVVEATLLALAFLFALWRFTPIRLSMRPNFAEIKPLVKEALPILVAGLGVVIYMRIDQVILGVLLGQESVGIYAAAVRISEIWYFVPAAIAASVFPSSVASRDTNPADYSSNLRKLHRLMWGLSGAAILLIFWLGETLILGLYGTPYASAHPVLLVQILGGVFVSLSLSRNNWLMAENLQIYTMIFTGSGAIVNIGLNFYLIPKYGVLGAAYATALSYASVVVGFPLLFKTTRKSVYDTMWPFELGR